MSYLFHFTSFDFEVLRQRIQSPSHRPIYDEFAPALSRKIPAQEIFLMVIPCPVPPLKTNHFLFFFLYAWEEFFHSIFVYNELSISGRNKAN